MPKISVAPKNFFEPGFITVYEGLSKSFQTSRLERELQMV
jgi:hypothetical protein